MTRSPDKTLRVSTTCPYCGRDRRVGADTCSHCDDLPSIDDVLHGIAKRIDG